MIDRFINAKDHLLLRYIKYLNPFSRRQKKPVTSKFKSQKQNQLESNYPDSFVETNQPVVTNFASHNLTTTGRKMFKEAVLSIK